MSESFKTPQQIPNCSRMMAGELVSRALDHSHPAVHFPITGSEGGIDGAVIVVRGEQNAKLVLGVIARLSLNHGEGK